MEYKKYFNQETRQMKISQIIYIYCLRFFLICMHNIIKLQRRKSVNVTSCGFDFHLKKYFYFPRSGKEAKRAVAF